MEDINLEEVIKLVEDAQTKGKFNLEDVIKGTGYPEDSVDVYVDSEHAYELSKLNDALLSIFDPEEAEPLEARAKELAGMIMSSKLTFHFRGISQETMQKIESEIQEPEKNDKWWAEYTLRLIAANIVSVTDAEGNIDDTPFTLERVQFLEGHMPAESWKVIVSTMQKLTLASGYFKGATDAGFLPKS